MPSAFGSVDPSGPPKLGGGLPSTRGNSAMDAARTAKRLLSRGCHALFYRRDEARMSALAAFEGRVRPAQEGALNQLASAP